MGSIAPEARRALFLETASSPPRRALLDATGVATGGACGFFFPVFPLPTPSLLGNSAVSGSSQPPFFTTFTHRTHPVCGGALVNRFPFSVSSRHFAMAASFTRHTAPSLTHAAHLSVPFASRHGLFTLTTLNSSSLSSSSLSSSLSTAKRPPFPQES